jgi:hypothetical protein
MLDCVDLVSSFQRAGQPSALQTSSVGRAGAAAAAQHAARYLNTVELADKADTAFVFHFQRINVLRVILLWCNLAWSTECCVTLEGRRKVHVQDRKEYLMTTSLLVDSTASLGIVT